MLGCVLLVTPFSVMAGKYEAILENAIEKKAENERVAFIEKLEWALPVLEKKFKKEAMNLTGSEKSLAEAKAQLVRDLIVDLAIVKPQYVSSILEPIWEEETLLDTTSEMNNDSQDGTYYGIKFTSYGVVVPAEKNISISENTINIGDMSLSLHRWFSDHMGLDVYHNVVEKTTSYGKDIYQFVIALDNGEFLYSEFQESNQAYLGYGPEFAFGTLFWWDEGYYEKEWYLEEDSYVSLLDKLALAF